MADNGDIRRGIILAYAALVFTERHVQYPVELVFYALYAPEGTVQTHGGQHPRCRCLRTADKVPGFLGCRVADLPLAINRDNAA